MAIRGRHARKEKIRLQYLIDHPDYDDHRSATQKVAERFDMDPKKVEITLRRFLVRANVHIRHRQKIIFINHFTIGWTAKGRRILTIKERRSKAAAKRKLNKARRKVAHFIRLERDYYRNDNLMKIYRDS